MSLPPIIRIFFAIDLPSSMKDKIGHFISILKKKSKSHAIRWTKPENLHITLQFLAEMQTADLSQLSHHVRQQLSDWQCQSSLALSQLQLFPHPFRPRVIVLEVNPQEELRRLSQAIGRGMVATHYATEDRPFRAHLTLGRIKHTNHIHLKFLSELEVPSFEKFEVKEVVLFRSEPQPEGSHYVALERMVIHP